MRRLARVALIGAAALYLAATRVWADPDTLTVGYLEIEGDPRYRERRPYAGIFVRTVSRPYPGAELGIKESRIQGRAIGARFALDRFRGSSSDDLVRAIEQKHRASDVRYFLLDAQSGIIADVARRTRDLPVLLFNIADNADELRGAHCQPHLLHVAPSYAMLSDALVQHIVSKKWRDVFLLVGASPEDAKMGNAFRRSARRFGARIIAHREFVLTNDPRQRDKSNVSLMTAGERYDVVYLVDSDGEFGRYVPYDLALPRPVIGTEGLLANTWFWAWERHGAPQLNQRFDRVAGRTMKDLDWAAWVGVKVIVEAAVRTRSKDFESIAAYLESDRLTVDGYKGDPMNFRPWDGQLRQPILLHTHNAVIGRAPLRGFLHATNNLDTLGFDRSESRCRM